MDQPARQFFYNLGVLNHVLQPTNSSRLFRTERRLLAQSNESVYGHAWGIAQCDDSHSPLAIQRLDRRRSVCYTVYGYAPQFFEGLEAVGFQGEHFESCLQAYVLGNGYRVYSPSLMRFMRPDHLSPFGRGGLNAYAYASGDPINRADPTGGVWIPKLLGNMWERSARGRTPQVEYYGVISPREYREQRLSTAMHAKQREYLRGALRLGTRFPHIFDRILMELPPGLAFSLTYRDALDRQEIVKISRARTLQLFEAMTKGPLGNNAIDGRMTKFHLEGLERHQEALKTTLAWDWEAKTKLHGDLLSARKKALKEFRRDLRKLRRGGDPFDKWFDLPEGMSYSRLPPL